MSREERRGRADTEERSERGLSRRQLLSTGTAAAAAAALNGPLIAQSDAEPDRLSAVLPKPVPRPRNNVFPQPRLVCPDRSGDTNVGTLDVSMSSFNFCNGNRGVVRSYNGFTPGPTLMVNPGHALNLELVNNLPANVADCENGPDFCGCSDDMNIPHCFNTTNMHFHGLHVSPCSIWDDQIPNCEPGHTGQPRCASDDITFTIKPTVEGGLAQQYSVNLPDFQAPGTHWYHAHKHGSTAIQLANGLAGALIVPDPVPIVPGHKDYIWLMQEVLPNNDDYKIYPGNGTPDSTLLVNGECCPTLVTQTGMTLRLRFINATGSPRGFTRLKLVKCEESPCFSEFVSNPCARDNVPDGPTKTMYLMAVDGLLFYGHRPQPRDSWDMSPGNRADFLVQFDPSETGTYMVVKDQIPGVNAQLTQVLGFIEVQPGTNDDPAPPDVPLPPRSEAPPYLEPIEGSEICRNQDITYHVEGSMDFRIGWPGQSPIKYDDTKFIDVYLGCTEAWTLLNTSNDTGRDLGQPHPFHVHVNPFQIAEGPREIQLIDLDGPDQPDNRIWYDTVSIPSPIDNGDDPQTPGRLVVWMRFLDYPGVFVTHCHVLVHEDLGMMANVFVKDPKGMGAGPCEPLRDPVPRQCQNPMCSQHETPLVLSRHGTHHD